MNDTPQANRIHIGFFGRRNAGKSSVVNAVTNQELSVVSEVMGTTTDPVTKSMELLPIGPVLIIDTPGFDDEGKLGELRVKRTKQVLNKTDIAVLIVDATVGLTPPDYEIIDIFREKNINYLLVYNKCDLLEVRDMIRLSADENAVLVSAKDKKNIDQLKEKIAFTVDSNKKYNTYLVSDLLTDKNPVMLVVPIDKAAPKGRLILPQQQVIRDLLDNGIPSIVVKENQVAEMLNNIGIKPSLVITDSQVFNKVAEQVPDDILLTSFSILMARYKGFLEEAVKGAFSLDNLKSGDKILISEGCTHHRQCGDIGTVKLPNWINEFTGAELVYEFTSGTSFPDELSCYNVIIHCGGCMLNEREMKYRMKCAIDQGVPFTNYGTVIAYINGILHRTLEIFKGSYR
ncbi:MAG: [Lachnospiraceae bacterium]|nr:[FeFe] hydrogenase H-cluster maturation GTPase HydF [Lachnospiraceae bacterium]